MFEPKCLIAACRQLRAEQSLARDGFRVHHYFDTSDVRNVILGAHGYYDRHNVFDAHAFDSTHALVWSLVASGNISPIRLFAPHQAELLTLLQYRFHRESGLGDTARLKAFTDVVADRETNATSFDERVTVAMKGLAAAWLPWQARLSALVNRNTLDLATVRHDYTSVVQEKPFHALYEHFERVREKRTVNNFADAAALTSLLIAARACGSGESRDVPFFYSSSPLFESGLERTKLRDQVRVTLAGQHVDLLCTPEYFVVRALVGTGTDRGLDLPESIRNMIDALSDGEGEADLHALRIAGEYEKIVAAVFSYSFYQHVWLPNFRAARAFSADSSFSELANEKTSRWVDAQLAGLISQLRGNTITFRRIRDVWIEIDESVTTFGKRTLPEDPLLIDGLVRFSFPRRVQKPLIKHIHALRSRDIYAVDGVVALLYRILDTQDPPDEDVAIAASLMWVLRLDRRLLVLLAVRPGTHHSLRILQGAALLRSGGMLEKAKAIAQDLNRAFLEEKDRMVRAELAIGIAYLDFRLAKAAGFRPSWEVLAGAASTPTDEGLHYMAEAIERARSAAGFETWSPMRSAYASNIYLYYLVAANVADDALLRKAAARLTGFQYEKGVWQARFDDTLGRYFYLRSHRQTESSARAELLSWALDAAKIASAGDPDGDDDIAAFFKQVKIECDGRPGMSLINGALPLGEGSLPVP